MGSRGEGRHLPRRSVFGSGFTLSGKVLRAGDCKPVKGAVVEVWQETPGWGYVRRGRASVLTDETGGVPVGRRGTSTRDPNPRPPGRQPVRAGLSRRDRAERDWQHPQGELPRQEASLLSVAAAHAGMAPPRRRRGGSHPPRRSRKARETPFAKDPRPGVMSKFPTASRRRSRHHSRSPDASRIRLSFSASPRLSKTQRGPARARGETSMIQLESRGF